MSRQAAPLGIEPRPSTFRVWCAASMRQRAMRAPCESRTRFIQLGGLAVFRLTLRCGAVPAGLEPALSALTGRRLIRLGHETSAQGGSRTHKPSLLRRRGLPVSVTRALYYRVLYYRTLYYRARGGGRTRSRRLTKTVHRRLCYSSIQWTAWESNPPRDACKAPSLPGAYPALDYPRWNRTSIPAFKARSPAFR